MKCPFCRQTNTEVYNTRNTKFHSEIWRRRRCLDCSQAFTTYESPNLGLLKVISHNRLYPYSRAKLFSSIYMSFVDGSGQAGDIDAVTSTIEAKLLDLSEPEITPKQIVQIVLA